MSTFTMLPSKPAAFSLLLLALAAMPPARAQISGTPETNDRFSDALAAGDFDNDNYADLAVGVPYEDVGAISNAGSVNVIYGGPGGLSDTGDQSWSQNSSGVADAAEANDRFGAALATGDFDGDGYDDLAIGAPGEGRDGFSSVGQLHVLYGGPGGLTSAGSFHLPQLTFVHTGKLLGDALAAGDFDNDGRDDLAVGIPGQNLGGANGAGAIVIYFGSPSGVVVSGYQVWHQNVAGISGTPETGDNFGAALAVGRFDEDGYADLAIGVPGENVGSVVDAGAVHVLYSTASGPASAGSQLWHQNVTDIVGVAGTGDQFGAALAAGNFDSVGDDDLAIGVPGESVGSASDAGAVNVIYSGDFIVTGLLADGNEIFHQDVADVPGVAEASDQFGYALAAGSFGFGPSTDLAIGVPGEDDDGFTDIGVVYVIAGLLASGLNPADDQLWYQNSPGVLDASESGDQFGRALTGGNFDAAVESDLAVGVPFEDVGGALSAGAVNVLYNDGDNGLSSLGDEFWYQGGTGTSLIAGDEGDEVEAAREDVSASLITEAPATLALLPAAPNPFHSATTLRFTLPAPGAARLAVYDLLGREVAVLADGLHEAGEHTAAFDAAALPAGAYLVRLQAGGAALTERLTLVH